MDNDGAVGNKTESMCISEVNPTGHVKRVGDDINTADDKKEKKRESRMTSRSRSIREDNGSYLLK